MQFHIKNMTCGGCTRGITGVIQSVDSAARVVTDPAIRNLVVTSSRARAEFEAVLAEAGYPAAQAG